MQTSDLPTVEVLICTYDNGFENVEKCLASPCPHVRYLISHQVSAEYAKQEKSINLHREISCRDDVRIVRINGSGLAKNRNHALDHATGDILLIADDDVAFVSNLHDKISKSFKLHPEAIAATFQIHTHGGRPYKRYSRRTSHNKLSVFGISSIELAFRRSAILELGLRFDEQFGLNAEFPCSEEIVFAGDILAIGKPFPLIPEVIVYHSENSSGKDYQSPASCRARGAAIRRVFGWIGFPAIVLYALKHRKEVQGSRTIFSFVKLASTGFFSVSTDQSTSSHTNQPGSG